MNRKSSTKTSTTIINTIPLDKLMKKEQLEEEDLFDGLRQVKEAVKACKEGRVTRLI